MSHPFFDAAAYPWSQTPQAQDLPDVLSKAVDDPKEIERVYKSRGEKLPPLFIETNPLEVWKEALERLTAAHQLRGFCYDLHAGKVCPLTPPLEEAVRAVIEAQAVPAGAAVTPDERPTPPGATRGWLRGRTAAAAAGLVGVAVGWPVGHLTKGEPVTTPPETLSVVAPPKVVPAVTFHFGKDEVIRTVSSASDRAFVNSNVNAASTVLVVDVGPWSTSDPVHVRITPAEYESQNQATYQKAYAVLKGSGGASSVPVAWDAIGSLAVRDVRGQPGDHLYVFVVIPITDKSGPLLSHESTRKRFLCVEVTP